MARAKRFIVIRRIGLSFRILSERVTEGLVKAANLRILFDFYMGLSASNKGCGTLIRKK